MTVGGWFDAEDPLGPLYMYRSIQKNSAKTDNILVMGPWSHGGWARGDGEPARQHRLRDKTAEFYREQIEFPFFEHHLKDAPLPAGFPEAYVFETGTNQWRSSTPGRRRT